MTSDWVIEAPSNPEWATVYLGPTARLTELGALRLLEDGSGYRVIEYRAPAIWSPETTPPATWT